MTCLNTSSCWFSKGLLLQENIQTKYYHLLISCVLVRNTLTNTWKQILELENLEDIWWGSGFQCVELAYYERSFFIKGSLLPCFTSGSASSTQVMKSRFHMNLTEEQLLDLVNTLVDQAINSLTTKLYDGFQYYSNGIL